MNNAWWCTRSEQLVVDDGHVAVTEIHNRAANCLNRIASVGAVLYVSFTSLD